MAQTDTQLLLRLSADVQRFQKQMARITKAGETAAVGVENRFKRSHQKMSQSAERSAGAIASEMDRLRAKYDPVFAASKRYEAQLDELNRAQRVGALTTQQYDAALERLNAEYARQAGAADMAAAANRRVTTATRGMGGGIQNVAFQVGDFATQVGAGTSASIALGQQLPQLMGGFGAVGAILGAVVAVAVPLASSFINIGDAGEDMQEKIDRLKSAVDEYIAASEQALLPTDELTRKYGEATGAAQEFLMALRNIAQVNALEEIDATFDRISKSLGNFREVRSRGGVLMEADAVRKLREELEVAGPKAEEVAQKLQALGQADTPDEWIPAAQAFLRALEDSIGPYEEMNAQQREIYDQVAQTADKVVELTGAANGAAGAIGGAASEAGRLADELGRAVENSINLAAQGISDAKRAKIEYELRDDPVGRATALARERFDAQTEIPENAEPSVANEIENNRQEYIEAAAEAERYRQRLIQWRKDQADASRSGSGGSGGGGSSGSSGGADKPGLFERSDQELVDIERKMEMLGKEASEVAALKAKYDLLDEAKKRDLDLDARQADTGETLRQQIERQSQSIGDLTGRYEQARERADYFVDIQADLKDGFLDAIVAGEGLAGTLESVAQSLAKAALQAALFNEGPFVEGGGILGSIGSAISGAFGGGKAAGGPVRAGSIYDVGEHGRERFVPEVNGRILSAQQAIEASRPQVVGGAGGAVEVIGGDLMLSDNGALMAKFRVVARGEGEAAAGRMAGRMQQKMRHGPKDAWGRR